MHAPFFLLHWHITTLPLEFLKGKKNPGRVLDLYSISYRHFNYLKVDKIPTIPLIVVPVILRHEYGNDFFSGKLQVDQYFFIIQSSFLNF